MNYFMIVPFCNNEHFFKWYCFYFSAKEIEIPQTCSLYHNGYLLMKLAKLFHQLLTKYSKIKNLKVERVRSSDKNHWESFFMEQAMETNFVKNQPMADASLELEDKFSTAKR